jgi:hypothetical protein
MDRLDQELNNEWKKTIKKILKIIKKWINIIIYYKTNKLING